ncbi:MAG TPA: hypothetical protein VHE09_13525 [Rhizomicrobium sp.]|jgi:hypothetical protein|nr:hypothetical protein [Rhizomicrobium sp.]
MHALRRFFAPTAVLLVVLPSAQALAAVQTADCKVKKAAFAASNELAEITSKTYVNAGAAPFHQRGKSAACIIVRFDTQTIQNSTMQVRALLDGSIMFPGETSFTQNDGFVSSSHGFSWEGVAAPGSHTVQIQVLSSDGSVMYIVSYFLSVQHL